MDSGNHKLALVNLMKEAEREPDLREVFRNRGFGELLRLSEKFIFDTGMDRDEDTTTAIRETGFAMVEQGRFHLPYPITWIEDPFPDDTSHRRCYLCVEHEGVITVAATIEDFGKRTYPIARMSNAQYVVFDIPICIDTNKRPGDDNFTYAKWPPEMVAMGVSPVMRTMVGEVLYAIGKFIVVLATRGTERERCQRTVRGASSKRDNPKDYPFTIVRVPLDTSAPQSAWGGTHTPPRKHLVRGYQWGKHTRSPEGQKWIDPYWRGHEERGVIQHQHYEVG